MIATDMTAGVKAKYDGLIEADLTPIKNYSKMLLRSRGYPREFRS